MLAVHLHKRFPRLAQQGGTHRLVVDEGARRAAGADDTFQGQRLVGRGFEAMFRQHVPHRMAGRYCEFRCNGGLLGPRPDHGTVGRRAERQRQGVKNDRLTSPGLPGQRGKAAARLKVETIDQDKITNGQSKDHLRSPNSTEALHTIGTKAEQIESSCGFGARGICARLAGTPGNRRKEDFP